jgi:hypothetical protein
VRKFALALACVLSLTAQAQVPVITPQMLMPNPLGVVIMVGQWLIQDNKRVYYIQVQTKGVTFQEARDNGFRLATEQAVGTVVLSETEIRNQRIVRDEIITYASGFVDRFDVKKTDMIPGGYQVTMDVWIGESKIANRLLNDSATTGALNGDRLAVQNDSLQLERAQGDRVLGAVLNDFPRRAFDVELDRNQVNFNSNRQLQIAIPVTVRWNRDYIKSLYQAAQAVGQEPERCLFSRSCAEQQARMDYLLIKGKGTVVGWNGQVGFDDSAKLGAIVQRMTQHAPALLITLSDYAGNRRYESCQPFILSNLEEPASGIRPTKYMVTVANRTVTIDERYVLEGQKQLNFSALINGPRDLDRIDARVVDRAECNKRL